MRRQNLFLLVILSVSICVSAETPNSGTPTPQAAPTVNPINLTQEAGKMPSSEVKPVGSSLQEVNKAFLQVVAGLAVLLIAVHALRYVTSDNPQERADIKKGIIYIIIGVLIAYLAAELVEGIYCFALHEAFGISIGDCRALI